MTPAARKADRGERPDKADRGERRIDKLMTALQSTREEFLAEVAALPLTAPRIMRALTRRMKQLAEANDDRLPVLSSALAREARGTAVAGDVSRTLNGAAKAALGAHNWSRAIGLLDLVLELAPGQAGALRRKASALFNVGEPSEAVAILQDLLVDTPSNVGAASLLARHLEPNQVVEIGRKIAPLAVAHADARPAETADCVRVLIRLMCVDQAAGLLARLTDFQDPAIADAAFDIGISTNDAALASRALEERRWSPEERPEQDVWRTRLALLRADRDGLVAPFESLSAAGRLDLLERNLRLAGQALGRYADAFSLDWNWDRRLRAGRLLHRLIQPDEPPERLAGAAVLIVANAELGDEIRLMELVDRVRAIARSCTIVVDRRIAGLVARHRDGFVVVGTEKVAPVPRDSPVPEFLRRHLAAGVWSDIDRFDKVVLTEDLQAMFVRTVNDLPSRPRTFETDPALRAKWRGELERLGPRPRVGLFWRSGRINYSRSAKFTRLEDWAAVFDVCQGPIVSLQFGAEVPAEIAALAGNGRVVEMPGLNTRDDLDSVAALMCELDCVVTVPGTTMHLAGAVGARTLAVSHPSEMLWRARPDGVTGTWSPSVEMVTGPSDSGFDGAILAASRRLQAILAAS